MLSNGALTIVTRVACTPARSSACRDAVAFCCVGLDTDDVQLALLGQFVRQPALLASQHETITCSLPALFENLFRRRPVETRSSRLRGTVVSRVRASA